MAAFKLLDKALTQLKIQKEFGVGGMAFAEPSLTPHCTNIQGKQQQSQAAAQAVTPRTPLILKSKVHWAPGLELLGGNHEPWTVSQPTKPILKAQEYSETGYYFAQAGHGDCSDSPTSPMISSAPASKPTCIKLLSQKRTREVAFLD